MTSASKRAEKNKRWAEKVRYQNGDYYGAFVGVGNHRFGFATVSEEAVDQWVANEVDSLS